MIYLINGTQKDIIKSRIKKICKDHLNEIDDFNFVRYNYEECNLIEVIEEANSIPLGYDLKVISLENCSFLLKEEKSLLIDETYKEFISYLTNPCETTILILSVLSASIDKKTAAFKAIEKTAKCFELKEPSNEEWKEYCKKYFANNNCTIENDALDELCNRVKGDLTRFKNEANKLMLYTNNVKYNDIVLFVNKQLEDRVFDLFNHLVAGRINQAVGVFKSLKKQNIDELVIIPTLATSFRTYNEVLYLYKNNKNASQIASILKMSESRASVLLRQVHKISPNAITRSIEDLYKLYVEIKSGRIDRSYGLELFIIKFKTI